VLITLFLFITAPVSAHLLAKAALHLGLRGGPEGRCPTSSGAEPPFQRHSHTRSASRGMGTPRQESGSFGKLKAAASGHENCSCKHCHSV